MSDLRYTALLRNPAFKFTLSIIFSLLIFKLSKAGYYASNAFEEYALNGYLADPEALSLDSPLNFIGTIGSVLSILFLPFSLTTRRHAVLSGLLWVSSFIAFTSIWSDVAYPTVISMLVNALAIVTLGAVFLLSKERLFSTFFYAVLGIVVVSLFISFSDSMFQKSLGAIGWRGLFLHKNGFASFCFFAFVVIYPYCFHNSFRFRSAFISALLIASIYVSEGKTAFYLSILYGSLVLLFVVFSPKYDGRRSILFVKAVTFLCSIGVFLAIPILLIGDFTTLTGRTILWRYFLVSMNPDPIIGYGGLSLKLNADIAYTATKMVGLPSPDSSHVLILFNWGLLGLVGYVFFIWWLLYKQIGSQGLASFASSLAVLSYVIYGMVESFCYFNVDFSLLCVVILIVIEQGRRPIGIRMQSTIPRRRRAGTYIGNVSEPASVY